MLPTRNLLGPLREMQPSPQNDPPPYEDTFSEFDLSDSSDDEDCPQPLTFTINAASSVHGCHNLVQTPPPPFADITSLSNSVLQTLNQIIATSDVSAAGAPKKRQRVLKVDLTINCGITVIGDRNVVGGIGLRHKGTTATAAPAPAGHDPLAEAPIVVDAASVGAKRKAEDPPESESEPLAKRCAVDGQV